MGGFAVLIDWDRPVDPHATDPMMALVPHRATGGTRTQITPHAVLAEGRTTHQVDGGPWEVATLGPLAIVGDIRLFDTGRLRAAAGGTAATDGLDHHQLLLAAYRRKGIQFLDAVDGDFAFVIWDDAERRVLAVRDRFAVKPIFYEETGTGIRFASEVKQLACTSTRLPRPDPGAVRDFLTFDFQHPSSSFFNGVSRILAASAVDGTVNGITERRYWTPVVADVRHVPSTLPEAFREHLVEAVDRRLRTADTVAAQLSGGLDSSSVVASADLALRAGGSTTLSTVSAVFDMPSIDESGWIADTVAMHGFPHDEFVPDVGPISLFDEDMHTADGPWINPIRDLMHGVAGAAMTRGASLILTGDGGDYLLDQYHYLADLLSSHRYGRFLHDAYRSARWAGARPIDILDPPLRQVAPQNLKQIYRRLAPATTGFRWSLAAPPRPAGATKAATVTDRQEYPSRTQRVLVEDLAHPMVAWINEVNAATFATHGLDISHPYLDRELVAFAASIHPLDLPFDGRSKTLVRQGFAPHLPRSVLDRRAKTTFDEYLAEGLLRHHDAYRDRFPEVPASADALIDPEAYRAALSAFARRSLDHGSFAALRRAWHVMAWVDQIDQHTPRTR